MPRGPRSRRSRNRSNSDDSYGSDGSDGGSAVAALLIVAFFVVAFIMVLISSSFVFFAFGIYTLVYSCSDKINYCYWSKTPSIVYNTTHTYEEVDNRKHNIYKVYMQYLHDGIENFCLLSDRDLISFGI